MPTYEYECESCASRFELRRSFGENGDVDCPQCGGEARRIFSPVPVFFKGSGFYVTDGGGRKRNSASRPTSDDKGQGDGDEVA